MGKKKILIIGGCGYIGSRLLSFFDKKDFIIKILDIEMSGDPAKINNYKIDYNNLSIENLSKYNFKDCIKILYENRGLLDKPPHYRPHFQHNWDKQHPYLYKKHELQVDHVLRFERIDEVADWLHTLYGLTIPKINVSTDGEDYIKHYDDEMVDLVGKIYEEDIRILGYNFGD
mgnify:CR=1 FL=1